MVLGIDVPEVLLCLDTKLKTTLGPYLATCTICGEVDEDIVGMRLAEDKKQLHVDITCPQIRGFIFLRTWSTELRLLTIHK